MRGKFLKKLTWVCGLLIIVGGIIYLILFSPKYANQDPIISYRYDYEWNIDRALAWLKLPKIAHCAKTGIPVQIIAAYPDEKLYRYSLQGKLVKIDKENKQITTLSCGKQYIFNVEMNIWADGTVAIEGLSEQALGLRKYGWLYNADDLNKSSEKDPWYNPDHMYDVVWKDKRRLPQILSEYKQDPNEAINKIVVRRIEIKRD